jgi:hypothetical protein
VVVRFSNKKTAPMHENNMLTIFFAAPTVDTPNGLPPHPPVPPPKPDGGGGGGEESSGEEGGSSSGK